MTEQEIIEKLKDKDYVRPLGLMSVEEQNVYWKVGAKNCMLYGVGGRWIDKISEIFMWGNTYAIKPDYKKPEPEYVDYEIETWYNGRLSCKTKNCYLLYELPSLPNFFCFWQEENGEGYKDTEHISLEVVATAMNGGNKVYARFRK